MTLLQPGSSVSTSLTEGEAIPKHCFMVEIYEGYSNITPIRLKRTRPMLYKQLTLSEIVCKPDEIANMDEEGA